MFDKVASRRFIFFLSLYRKLRDLKAGDIHHETLDSAEIHGNSPSDSSLLWVKGFFEALQIGFMCCAAELNFRPCFFGHTLFYKNVCVRVVWLGF